MKRFAAWVCLLIPAAFSQVPPAYSPRYPPGVDPSKLPSYGPKNLDFHEGLGGGWFVPRTLQAAGYSAELSRTGCKTTVCAVVTTPPAGARPAKPALPGGGFGNLMQSFDATEYRGRMIRLRASLRLDSVSRNDRAQMWVRVDCVQGMACGFDNMDDRPVRSATWKNAEIRVRVPEDAVTIYFGVMSLGHGRAWIDEISLESGPK